MATRGSPASCAQGLEVGRRCVARLMRDNGIVGIPKRKFKRADITYLPIVGSFVYLAILIDLFSRKGVGWALDSHMRTDLCLTALSRAVVARQPAPGLIHHSDRGSQYCSGAYQQALSELGAVVSMSRKGNC